MPKNLLASAWTDLGQLLRKTKLKRVLNFFISIFATGQFTLTRKSKKLYRIGKNFKKKGENFNLMSDISKIKINGVLYDISDLVARENLDTHANDKDVHITVEERSLWNSGRVITKTTSEWTEDLSFIPTAGYLCVYSDYKKSIDASGNEYFIPAIKVGDGTTYVVDLPFLEGTQTQDFLNRHISDTSSHITEEERAFWNNKVSCAIDSSNPEQIIFSTL